MATGKVKHSAERAIGALNPGMSFETITLIHSRKLVGVLAYFASNVSMLDLARSTLSAASTMIAQNCASRAQQQSLKSQLKEARLMYQLATLAPGSTSYWTSQIDSPPN